MKKVLINLLSLNGTTIELKKTDETSHFSEASVFYQLGVIDSG